MSNGYRSDEELYVYDQCCGNCANHGSSCCPMYLDKKEERVTVIREQEKKRREDAILREGEPEWCIYWKQQGGRSYY